MSKEGGIAAFCVLCFLFFITMSPGIMAFAAQGKQVGQLSADMGGKLPVNPSLDVNKPKNHLPSSHQKPKHLKRTPPSPNIKAAGTTWCIAKPSTPQDQLEKNIQFSCNEADVDCKPIQQAGTCYFPTNQVSNASVVMNIYYRVKGKQPFNCYYNGSGLIVDQDPSVGNCIYQA